MSFLSNILSRLGRGRAGDSERMPDEQATTGTGESGTFVGRVSGEDPGYLDSGADRRAEDDESPPG